LLLCCADSLCSEQ